MSWSPPSFESLTALQACVEVLARQPEPRVDRVDGDATTLDDLNGVWGSGPSDVYVVGGNETVPGHAILHYDGTSWSVVDSGDERKSTLLGVWGTSSTDVMAVGAYRDDSGEAHAQILHFDGETWVEIPNELNTFLWDVWCARAGDCYVVGPDDTVVHVTRVGE